MAMIGNVDPKKTKVFTEGTDISDRPLFTKDCVVDMTSTLPPDSDIKTEKWHYTKGTNGQQSHLRIIRTYKGTRMDNTLNQNQKLYNETDIRAEARKHGSDDVLGVKVASIPRFLLLDWSKEDGVDYWKNLDNPEVKKKFIARINNRDFSKLRTAKGRV